MDEIINGKKAKFLLIALCILLSCSLSCSSRPKPASNSDQAPLKLHFIDVAYGDAILIEPANSPAILLDAGPASSSKRLLEFLEKQKLVRLEIGILTHPHENHFGGFASVLLKYPFKKLYFNGDSRADPEFSELVEKLKKRKIPLKVVSKGSVIKTANKDLKLRVLHPKRTLSGNVNDAALVLLLEFKEISLLFFSDVGPLVQTEILSELKDSAKIDAVLLPHHGDILSDKFVRDLAGKIFVLSCGKNVWGLPKEEEIKRLRAKIYRTDKLGHISFLTDGKNLIVNALD